MLQQVSIMGFSDISGRVLNGKKIFNYISQFFGFLS
jgi:hypothetical protein